MKNRSIKIYKSVYDRSSFIECKVPDFVDNDHIFKSLGVNKQKVLDIIQNETDKPTRNTLKRDLLPAVNFEDSGLFSIDIDGISHDKYKVRLLTTKLSSLDFTFMVCKSVSGNLVAFFKYECEPEEFKFLYYKTYLELTLILNTAIDFLPEVNRLRYLCDGGYEYFNNESKVLTELMDVDVVPYIKTSVTPEGARSTVYSSN